MNFRRFGSTIFSLGLIFFLFSTLIPIVQAAPLGCCEKTEKNDTTKKSYMDATEEECNAVPTQTNNFFTVKFTANAVALNNKECRQKPATKPREFGAPIYITPTVNIPGTEFTSDKGVKIEANTTTLANYIVAIFKYSTGIIGILAAIVLMMAGIIWVTAGGNQEQITNAKKMISGSIIGLVLAFGAFIILSVINTNLVNLKISQVTKVQYVGLNQVCVLKTAHDGVTTTSENMSQEECEKIQTTEVDPSVTDKYSKIDCISNYVAKGNKCVANELGCCQVTIKDWSIFGIIESEQKAAYCLNNIKEVECEERSSPFWRSFPGTSIWSQLSKKNGDNYDLLNDKFSTKFHTKKCQSVPECTTAQNGETY